MSALVVIPTYQEAENIATCWGGSGRRCPRPTSWSSTTAAPTAPPTWPRRRPSALGQIDVLRRAGEVRPRPAYRAGFAWGLERGHDRPDRDGRRPLARPGHAARSSSPRSATGGADLAIGSRYVPGGAVPGWPTHRRLLSQWGNRYVGFMLRMPVRDATAGFRAYRSSIIEKIGLDQVRADGYGFQIEMAYEVTKAGGAHRRDPDHLPRPRRGASRRCRPDIVSEALWLVTRWGVRDRCPPAPPPRCR